MSVANNLEVMLRERLNQIHRSVPGSIGDIMHFSLMGSHAEEDEYTFRCRTADWMRNFAGTLHGGMCATILDQAMGFVAYCAKPGEGIAPTVQLQVNYHRPLIPGEDVIVQVKVISVTKSLIHLRSEASLASAPSRECLTGTGIYFYKPKE